LKTVFNKKVIGYEVPRIMGILNVTPDSFSDGGLHKDPIKHAFRMIDEGADIIDIGGESTRPGFSHVSAEEEMRRMIPVIKELSGSSSIPISADTMKPDVAIAAIAAGADIINMVNFSNEMLKVIADSNAAVVIMHTPADIRDVHNNTMQGDVILQIKDFLNQKTKAAIEAGIEKDRIIVDPGMGFGKTEEQNYEILKNAGTFTNGFPVLIGASRKRFLSHAYPSVSKEDASILAARDAVKNGASIVRVHDVKRTKEAFKGY
jgi:dihydropteroate synthase